MPYGQLLSFVLIPLSYQYPHLLKRVRGAIEKLTTYYIYKSQKGDRTKTVAFFIRAKGVSMKSAARNIPLLMAIQMLRSFLVMIPVLVLFYQAKGLTMTEIMFIQAVFSGVMVIAEVPSGYFSDVLGRRRTMIIGTLCSTIGFAIYALADNVMGFLMAEIVLGIGISFISGTDSAMLFDSLAELGEQGQSMQKEGRQLSFGNFSESAASVLGGFLAMISLDTPLYVQAFFTALSVPLAFMLIEPKRHVYSAEHGTIKGILHIVYESIITHKQLRIMILLSGIVSAGTLTMVWFVQPLMKEAGVPLWSFGIAWATLNATTGFASLRAHTFEKRFGTRTLYMILSIALAIAYFLTGTISLWLLPFLLVFSAIRGIGNPVSATYINNLVSSDKRATVLSIRWLVTRIIFVIVGPIMGYIADISSLNTALYCCGIVFGIASIIGVLQLKENRFYEVL